VVVDRNLVTGQNPQSADAVADAVLKHMEVL
jgi:putative intracellular protease/amidase